MGRARRILGRWIFKTFSLNILKFINAILFAVFLVLKISYVLNLKRRAIYCLKSGMRQT